jgi:hypothetical protein
MTTGLDTSLELFTQLAEEFDEEKACEHGGHNRQPRYHGGKAEWYVQLQYPCCGRVGNVWALCDTWVKTAEVEPLYCMQCQEDGMAIFLVKEKIK